MASLKLNKPLCVLRQNGCLKAGGWTLHCMPSAEPRLATLGNHHLHRVLRYLKFVQRKQSKSGRHYRLLRRGEINIVSRKKNILVPLHKQFPHKPKHIAQQLNRLLRLISFEKTWKRTGVPLRTEGQPKTNLTFVYAVLLSFIGNSHIYILYEDVSSLIGNESQSNCPISRSWNLM